MKRHRPSAALVVAATALVVAIGGTAIAAVGAIPSDGRFTACYQTSDSLLNRIVLLAEPGEGCPNSYARVSWPAQATGGTQVRGPAGRRALRALQGPPGLRGRAARPGRGAHPTGSARRSSGSGLPDAARGRVRSLPEGTVPSVAVALSTSATWRSAAASPPGEASAGRLGGTRVPRASRPRSSRTFHRRPREPRSRDCPAHDHQYFLGPFLMALEKRALASDPPPVTVFAVCVRTLTRGRQAATRKG